MTNKRLGYDMPRVKLKMICTALFWIDSNCSVCARVIESADGVVFRDATEMENVSSDVTGVTTGGNATSCMGWDRLPIITSRSIHNTSMAVCNKLPESLVR